MLTSSVAMPTCRACPSCVRLEHAIQSPLSSLVSTSAPTRRGAPCSHVLLCMTL